MITTIILLIIATTTTTIIIIIIINNNNNKNIGLKKNTTIPYTTSQMTFYHTNDIGVQDFKGGVNHLPPKFEHIFVAGITFFPFLLCR